MFGFCPLFTPMFRNNRLHPNVWVLSSFHPDASIVQSWQRRGSHVAAMSAQGKTKNQRDRRYASGSRANRSTKTGYWKATGKGHPTQEPSSGELSGLRKTLVYYGGRAPSGNKTGWVMHEFRLNSFGIDSKVSKIGSLGVRVLGFLFFSFLIGSF